MSSKRRRRKQACGQKVRHASEGAAWKAIKARGMAAQLRPYCCPFCKAWHVGNRSPRMKRL